MSRKALIAIALMVASSGSAFAQDQSTFEAWGHSFTRSAEQPAVRNVPRSYDNLVTGSIYTSLGGRNTQTVRQPERQIDSSAKGGNAEHTNFLAPNYGGTSGGPAY